MNKSTNIRESKYFQLRKSLLSEALNIAAKSFPEIKSFNALNESKEETKLDYKKANAAIEAAAEAVNKKTTELGLLDNIHKDEYGTDVFRMHGGLNGPGKWTDYFHVIADFTDEISKSYHVWLIKLENDCLDDVFYADFGIMTKEEYVDL